MSVDLAQLGIEVRSDGVIVSTERLKQLGKAANTAETATERLGRQAIATGKKLQTVGKNLSLYVTTPLLALGVASVKTFADFDDAMTASLAIMGDLSDTMKQEMVDAARTMGRTTAFSAKQAAESYYFLASAGLSAEASVAALSKVAAFAQAGNFDMARATDILTDAQSALGRVMKDPIKNMEEMVALSDVLVKANTIANASVEQFGVALTNKAGTAMKDLNIDLETGVAMLAAWADQGVKAEEAGERFNIVTRDLQTAIRKNTQEWKDLGLSVFDAQGGIRNMTDIIADLEKVLGPMSTQQRGATLALLGFQDRSVIAIRSLIGLSDKMKAYEKNLRDVKGITDEVANKQMQSFSKQIGLVKAEIADLGIEIGGTMAPVLMDLVKEVKDGVKWFRELDKSTQTFIMKAAVFAAALGPLLLVFGGLFKVVGFLLPLLGQFSILLYTRVIPAFALWAAAMGGTFGITLLIQAIILALGFVIYKTIEWRRELATMTSALNLASDGADRFVEAINNARQASDLDDEIEEMISAAQRLELELISIEEKLAVFEGSADNDSNPLFAQLLADKDRVLAALQDIQTQYNALRERQRELAEGEKWATVSAAVLEELAAAFEYLDNAASSADNVVKLTKEEKEALEELSDELLPLEKEMKALAKAQALLEKAFKTGDLKPEQYAKLARALAMTSTAYEKAYEAAIRMKEVDIVVQQNIAASIEYVEGLELMEKQVQALADSLDPAQAQLRAMAEAQELLNEAFEAGVFEGREDEFYELSEAVEKATASIELADDAFMKIGSSALASLEQVQGMLHEDSAAAESLRSAMLALNVAMGIYAVIKQLSGGDVYSAIPRALGVAAMIAAMGVNTGAAGGTSTRTMQEAQGTGTVLGDAEAKSESLLNAAEITADATSELVGINRGMLHALQALQTGIGGATTQLARGADSADFSGALPSGELPSWATALFLGGPIGLWIDELLGGLFGGIINKLFGGKSKVLDEGIRIVGGALGDLTEDVFVQSFLRFKAKKHIFDDYDEYWQFQDLPEQVGVQFALVFGAIYDTVYEAALALGMDMDAVQAALEAYELGDIDISFQDLTGEEIKEELEAVFGAIFDDLALAVIPFIGDFQKVGEGLGETLVRVATSVQVFQEAVTALGFSADAVDAEAFAHMAVGLIELTGGVEEFISQFSTFFDTFASDERKLAFYTDQLTRAFESVGLTIPETRDGMIELMMSLDATTEEGRRQIAMLLEISQVADEYYDMMEEGTEALAEQAQDFMGVLVGFLGLEYEPLRALKDNFVEALEAAKALNATQREYAMIIRKFDLELKRMAASLRISILTMTEELFGSGSPLDPINDGLEETNLVANEVFEEWMQALERIFDFAQSILLDDSLTTLTPAEQLIEAQKQFDSLLARALAGDAEAAAQLPDAAQALLEEARFMYASGQQYTDIFDATLAALESVDIPEGIPPYITETSGGGSGLQDAVKTAAQAAIEALERYLTAVDLATALRDLAQVLDVSVITLATELGVPLRELAKILGVNLNPVDNTTARAIGDMAQLLGASVFELMDALGVNLMELAAATGIHTENLSKALATQLGQFADMLGANVFELAERMGVSIADLAATFDIGIETFSAEQFSSLIAFSEALGVGMADVANVLNIQLGSIRDATSLLSQGFDDAVSQLPPENAAEIAPYLTAIRTATDTTETELAINALGNYILGLPPEIAAPLIPYLDAMGFQDFAPELAQLHAIAGNTAGILSWQSAIVRAIAGIDFPDIDIDINIDLDGPTNAGNFPNNPKEGNYLEPTPYDPYNPIGSFATGGYVDQTGLYQLHAGEFVVDKNRDTIQPASDDSSTADKRTIRDMKDAIVDLRELFRRYMEQDLATSREIESSMKQQAEQTRRMANG